MCQYTLNSLTADKEIFVNLNSYNSNCVCACVFITEANANNDSLLDFVEINDIHLKN